MSSKEWVIETLLDTLVREGSALRVLDLGSGQSKNFLPFFSKYAALQYAGIEPIESEAAAARKALAPFPQASVACSLAYEMPPEYKGQQFDACVSLSVLEHVKQLEKLLAQSIAWVREGGLVVHKYDLGHALYPSSVKERFHVWLGNNTPWILPEKSFVNYVDRDRVVELLGKHGADVERITYHNMPSHKKIIPLLDSLGPEGAAHSNQLFKWETEVSPLLERFSTSQREHFFPTVCVWARKRSR